MSSLQQASADLTIISGTNRPDAFTHKVAAVYQEVAEAESLRSQLLDLRDLPRDFIHAHWHEGSPGLKMLGETFIQPVHRFVFIVPEYNGSYPGVMKAFMDCVPPRFFHGKKAGLVGVSSGRAGNLRGADQLTNVLNYLRVSVYYHKPKLSAVEAMFVHDKAIPELRETLRSHVTGLMDF